MTQVADNGTIPPVLTLNNDEIKDVRDSAPLTDQQKNMLEEFKLALPDILNPDKEVHDDEGFCDEACLIRYLRATKWHLADSIKRLKSTLDWRRSFQPHKLRASDFAKFGSPGQMYINGFDLDNHPIVHMVLKNAPLKQDDTKIKFMVYSLETCIKIMQPGIEKMCVLIDWRGQSSSNSMGLAGIKETINILGSHYPERLRNFLCVDSAWYLSTFFKLILPLFDPVTREKIVFINSKDKDSGDKDKILTKYIDKKNIISDFGGTSTYEFAPKMYFDMLAELDP
ncbi:CRAL/TRIO domain-containing protein [Conidiobolus coronatus NRRL 28638]|uniref:CRAL/TRIO domain-containing protein n=1 Tax=Conidiobolus coronatus (strain ATCC 28846 / CBS 209.66 / NRRL 28638) TaxID=796925 RepID=A0A137P643_CONC2|nr:CRAL/TRIO domain-containing protein [Conidiobolus coronatus NRRL 28638]|eukprot:KXN70414.1 CRAL/TRIO domain-containing protein [Conidiobolus coronatus NRRL 28638]